MANLTTKSINQIISRLKKVQQNSNKIDYWFFRYSLTWIKNRANTLLDQRVNKDYPHPTTLAREWTITYSSTSSKLENVDPNSGAIEFGIGIVGETERHSKSINDVRKNAIDSGYIYNQPSESKDETGGWNFYIDGNYIASFHGYPGKGFLYDSLMEYIQKKKYVEFYQKAFDKVMKGIIPK